MKFKTLLVAAAFATVLIGSNAFAQIVLNLSFDENSLAANTTGSFSISGSATSFSGSSNGWQTSGAGDSTGWFTLQVLTANLPVAGLTYNGETFTSAMVNSNLIWMGGGNNFRIAGTDTSNPMEAVFQIGNGTTDVLSGTFKVGSAAGIGSLDIAALNMSIGNVIVTASTSAVPEPATYAALAGGVILGITVLRRRRRSSASPTV